jgi:hypothetical protein
MASLSRRVGAPLVVAVATALPGMVAFAAAGSPEPDSSPTTTTLVDNPFFPDDTTTNITDCVSALPRPECGSSERGGWRQGVLFGIVAAGLAAIGLRIGWAIHRRDRD